MNNDERKELVTTQIAQQTGRILTELQTIFRWSSYVGDYRYNELNKQAMNAIITYVLASEAQEGGEEVDMTKFPKIIFHRIFEKLVLCDIREDFIDRILKLGNIDRKRFDEIIEDIIKRDMGIEFAKFITPEEESIEGKIFQASVKLATKMELFEIRNQIPEIDYIETISQIENVLNGYSDIPGFTRISLEYSKEMILFKKISALRNRIRWNRRLGPIKCAVLGHNFEVAIFSYLMALKEYGDEKIATRCFFTGVFHDVPETFTGDMPQPVKDAIPGLRRATEYFELEMVNNHIYANFPEYMREAMHRVMLEESGGEAYKRIVKKADYLSADLECLRYVIAGSKDPYFEYVIQRDLDSDRFDGVFYDAFKKSVEAKTF